MATKKQQLNQELENYKIEFSPDDELIALISGNTHSKMPRAINSVLRCLTLIAGGSALSTSCRLTGVSLGTLQSWRTKEWYGKAIEIIQKRLDEQLDGKMTYAVNKGISKTMERLEQGDAVLQKDGTLAYKPVTAKDAAIISSIFFDKRNLLRNKPTSISQKIGTDERLSQLASRFKDIANTAIDAEYEEVYDEVEPHEVETAPQTQQLQQQSSDESIPNTKNEDATQGKFCFKT